MYPAFGFSNLDFNELLNENRIAESKQINSDYRYRLAHLLFKAFEISFGKEKTIETLKSLIELSKTQSLTIDSWEQSAIKSGISKKSFADFKKNLSLK